MRIAPVRLASLIVMLACAPAFAQPTPEAPFPAPGDGERLFGMEFEFAGNGNRILHFEEMPFENYEKLMRVIVDHYNGNPEHIRKVTFMKETSNLERYPTGERELFRAEWIDPRGRKWMIEPEFVASTGYDGYELVTPPMDDTRDLERILSKIKTSGLVREGLKSGVHVNIDGRRLIEGNNARALANLIMLHENMEPTLRRLFNPVRGGGHANRFARSLAVDHPDLLEAIDRLPPEERTRERLEELFRAREGREATLHEVDPMDPNSQKKPWKYRSLNLAKMLNVNPVHNGNSGVVEFRMFDLAIENPELHKLEADVYRRMVRHAEKLAADGVDVRYQPRAPMPAGDNPTFYNTPEDPAEAKREASRMLREIGVDPAEFERVFETERFQPRTLASEGEFRGMLEAIPGERRTHNGAPFTFGFELEGRGDGLTNIMRPTDAEVDARWDTMDKTARKAYFAEVVTTDASVKTHFKPDPALWWLDPYWYVEGTGNWEIHSKVFESVDEIIRGMREAKAMTETSGKGFHLHMRDNAPDWADLKNRGSQFADFLERASNWVWLERARRLGTMTSLKSWSNARSTNADIENLANLRSSGRATVRTQISNPEYIDIEIRGFTKYVDDIEKLAKIFTEALKTGNYGPWKHTDTRLPSTGQGAADKSILLVDHVEKYLREVEGKEMSPEMRRIVEGMQSDFLNKAGGRARSLPGNLGAPLLDWDKDPSLPEDVRRSLKFERETYLRKVVAMARDIMAGQRGYGMDLNFASAEALAEKLGISVQEAEKLIEYRRARGMDSFTPEDVLRAMTAEGEADRLARLEALNLNEANERTLRERLGLSEAEARRVAETARAHEATEAMERAGINENRILEAIERGGAVDLATTDLSANELAERLRISPEAAERVLEHRGGFTLNNEAEIRAAGIEANRVDAVLEAATRTTNLNTASEAELRSLGLNDAELESVRRAREATTFRRYAELANAGISEATLTDLQRNGAVNMEALNTLSAEALAERAGITIEEAERITRFREARDLSSSESMRELLGERGAAIHERARSGIDLNTASAEELTRAGVTEAEAERLVNRRTLNRIGHTSSYTWSNFDANVAASDLLERGLVSEAEAEAIRANASDRTIENATAEELRARFGLTEAEATETLRLREARDMRTHEALVELGISEAEANRIVEATTELDPRSASRAEIMERTGLSENSVDRLIRITGSDLSRLTPEAMAERTGISAEEARNLVEFRDRHSFEESMERAGLNDRLTEIAERTAGADLSNMELSEAEIARRLGISPDAARKIAMYRAANTISDPARDLRTAGLNAAEIEAVTGFGSEVNLNEASAEELRRLGLTDAEIRSIESARGTNSFSRYAELSNAGLSPEAIEAISSNRRLNLGGLNSMSATEMVNAGMSSADADRIVRHRDATRMNENELRSILGNEVAERTLARAGGIDLNETSRSELRRAFGEKVGDRIANFRDAHELKYDHNRTFNAERAATEMVENNLFSNRIADAIRANGEAVDLSRATVAELTAERIGLSEAEARRVIEIRDANAINNAEALTARGLDAETAERIVNSTGAVDLVNVTAEELRARGFSEAEANRLVEIREAAKAIPGLNYKEIEKQIRFKVKLWARETQLSEALQRSLLPRINAANPVADTPENRASGRFVEGTTPTGEAEGFARTRTGATGEAEASRMELSEVRGIFESIRAATVNRTLSRMTNPALTEAERGVLESGIRNVRGLSLEVVTSNDILAEYAGNKVRVSSGLLNEIDARVKAMANATPEASTFLRSRILGLIFSHEASHSAGIRAERVADMEAIKVLEAAGLSRVGDANMPVSSPEIRAAVEAFDRPLGSSHIDNFLNRLRNFFRYGTTRGRVENLERTARGEPDKYERYRRADGTLKWKEMTRDGALREGVGVAHFALALFLKEVATVAATGDRARIEEFFDGLMTTDFYVHYGMFVAGARVGEVAYTKYLQRFVKPKFINGLLKTNLTLAAGIALPMIVGGHFEGKAFAITVGSLGLSTAAVKGGVSAIKWVTSLGKARNTGMLARMGLRAGRLSNVVGWVYTAAELAVILYVAETIEHNVNAAMDLAKARGELADAGREWNERINKPNATADEIRAANNDLHDAWSAYRNYLYTPLEIEEAVLASRLEGLARSAKIKADERAATLENLARRPALRASIERRYGSLEAYANSRLDEEEGEIREKLAMFTESYNMNREKQLEEVYRSHRRDTEFLGDVDDLDWHLAGAVEGAEGDPGPGTFGNWSRERARSSFFDALGNSSRNRMESYDDEAALLRAMAENLRGRGMADRAALLEETLGTVTATRIADHALINGENAMIDTTGLSGRGTGAGEVIERTLEETPAGAGE